MGSRAVQQVHEGEWLQWNQNERWICCDCHLTHTVRYRKRKGHLEVMMTVNKRSTSAYRRANGIKVTAKKK